VGAAGFAAAMRRPQKDAGIPGVPAERAGHGGASGHAAGATASAGGRETGRKTGRRRTSILLRYRIEDQAAGFFSRSAKILRNFCTFGAMIARQ